MTIRGIIGGILGGIATLGLILGSTLNEQGNIKRYLLENSSFIEKKDEADFSILDGEIKDKVVFLSGEKHATSVNQEMNLKFIKYFHEKAGVRYVIVESGYASSMLINRYLTTGDEIMLDMLFHGRYGAYSWSKEEEAFYRSLRKFNLSLPEEERIKLLGIDVEHQMEDAFYYLRRCFSGYIEEENMKSVAEGWKTVDEDSIGELSEDYCSRIRDYERFLKEDAFDFSMVLNNIMDTLEINTYGGKEYYEIREEKMYENFKRVYGKFPDEKFFGQFGYEHVYKSENDSFLGRIDRLAMKMNSQFRGTEGKVLSMKYLYMDSYTRDKRTNQPKLINTDISNYNLIEGIAQEDINIFKIGGENSPLMKSNYFVMDSYGGTDGEFYDYLVVLRNSQATKPYGN